MKKKILITGATDGLGYLAAKELIRLGHEVIIHGRSSEKLVQTMNELQPADFIRCDLSDLDAVHRMAEALPSDLDVLINNAGIFRTNDPFTAAGMDIRFAVNALAPLLLTLAAMMNMNSESRIISLSSAAQAPVNFDALAGTIHLDDEFQAYAQSKLALTQWTRHLAYQTDVLMLSQPRLFARDKDGVRGLWTGRFGSNQRPRHLDSRCAFRKFCTSLKN